MIQQEHNPTPFRNKYNHKEFDMNKRAVETEVIVSNESMKL